VKQPRELRETLARFAVLALVLAFPVVYVPRVVLGAHPAPIDLPARWASLIVVTTSAWPNAERDDPVFEEMRRRAAHVGQVYAPSLSAAGAAASLWTGRFPASHGVRSNRLALAPGTWTLAESERASGARTAAFLQEPFASVTGIEGFETVVEDPDLTPLEMAAAAASFLDEHVVDGEDERVCLWLHLAHGVPGADGSGLASLVDALRAHLEGSPRRFTSFLVVTGFGRTTAVHPDGRARVPLYAELSAGRAAGLEGRGAINLTDVAGAACEVLGLPLPGADEPPLQSRAQAFWANINGGGGFEWQFLESAHGDVLRFGKTRVGPGPDGALVAETTDTPAFDAAFAPAPEPLAPRLFEQYRALHAAISADGTAPVPAEAPPPWSGWMGW
jgi:hypothetical protein